MFKGRPARAGRAQRHPRDHADIGGGGGMCESGRCWMSFGSGPSRASWPGRSQFR